MLEWSWKLLDPDTRDLLVQLGVFSGGWTLEAAEAVCDDSASVPVRLETLVASSLVEPTGSEERTRFRMLEPVRQFSTSLFDEDPRREDLHARHLDWWLAQCRQRSTGQQWFSGTWAIEINDDFDNFRDVIDRALTTGRIDEASELLGGTIAGFFDGMHSVEVDRVLDQLAVATPEPAGRVLLAGAFNDIGIGRHVRLAERLEAARTRSRRDNDTACEAVATTYQGFSSATIDPAQAVALAERGVELARLVDDPEIVGLALGWAGATAFIAGDRQGALRWLDEARTQPFAEHSLAHFHCLFAEAFVLLGVGEVDAAEATLDESLHHLPQAGATRTAVHILKAFWHARRAEATAIAERANEALELSLSLGASTQLPDVALATCELLELSGHPERASELCAALHRQPLTHPLIYHRYRSIRSRLPEHDAPDHRLSPSELHGLAMCHLDTVQAE